MTAAHEITTPFGTVLAYPTKADTVRLAGALTVNGVPYSLDGFMHHHTEGLGDPHWSFVAHGDHRPFPHEWFTLIRADGKRSGHGRFGTEASPAAYLKAKDAVRRAVLHWIESNGDALATADAKDRSRAADTLRRFLTELDEARERVAENLRACEAGEPFSQYPLADLPSKLLR